MLPSTANGTDTSRMERLERGKSGIKYIVRRAIIHERRVNVMPIEYLDPE